MEQARAQLGAAQAEAVRANADVQRYQMLFDKDEVSRQRLDQAIATANRRSKAHIEGLNAELDDKARRDTQDAQKLRAIQDILDKQNGEP